MNLQGGDDWLVERAGSVTCSNLWRVFGSDAVKRTYALQIREQRKPTFVPAQQKESPSIRWGKKYEPAARAHYELARDVDIIQVGFVHHADIPDFGGSPDGLVGLDGAIELKCPYRQENHIKLFLDGLPVAYEFQCRGIIIVTDRDFCDFLSYDPRQTETKKFFGMRITVEDAERRFIEDGVKAFLNDWVYTDKVPDIKKDDPFVNVPELF